MRIDNPINPNQNVRNHLFDGSIWTPQYRPTATNVASISLSNGNPVTLITGQAGHRYIIHQAVLVPETNFISLSGTVDETLVMKWDNNVEFFSFLYVCDTSGLVFNPGQFNLSYPGGFDGGKDGDNVILTKERALSSGSVGVFLVYTDLLVTS